MTPAQINVIKRHPYAIDRAEDKPKAEGRRLWEGWRGGVRPIHGVCDVMWGNGDIDLDRDAEEIGELWLNRSDNPEEQIVAYAIHVDPEPKRETVTLYDGRSCYRFQLAATEESTHRITFDLIDGQPITGVYTDEHGDRVVIGKVVE